MAATKHEISHWFDRGILSNQHYMLVVVDTFDHSDYPVYSPNVEDARERFGVLDGPNMQRVIEVYDLRADKSEQMAERRVMRLPSALAQRDSLASGQ